MISNDLINKNENIRDFCMIFLLYRQKEFIIEFNGTIQDLYDIKLYPHKKYF